MAAPPRVFWRKIPISRSTSADISARYLVEPAAAKIVGEIKSKIRSFLVRNRRIHETKTDTGSTRRENENLSRLSPSLETRHSRGVRGKNQQGGRENPETDEWRWFERRRRCGGEARNVWRGRMRAGGIRDCSLLESGRAATRKAARFTSRGRANERIGREEEDNEAGRSRGGICDGEGEAWGIRRWGRSSYSWWGSAGEPGEGWSGWESRWTEGGGPPGRQSSLLTRFRQLRPPGLVFLARRSLEWRGQGGRPRLHTDTAGLADRRPDRTASRLGTRRRGNE
jgi:hypothetical protein